MINNAAATDSCVAILLICLFTTEYVYCSVIQESGHKTKYTHTYITGDCLCSSICCVNNLASFPGSSPAFGRMMGMRLYINNHYLYQQLVTLILSDVVGDPLDVIASGPTLPSHVSSAEVLHILEKFKLTGQMPSSVLTHLQAQDSRQQLSPSETKHRNIPVVNGEYLHVCNVVIGNNRVATEAAAGVARSLGYNSLVWSHQVQGEVKSWYSNWTR